VGCDPGASATGTPVQTLNAARNATTGAYAIDAPAALAQGQYTAVASQVDVAVPTYSGVGGRAADDSATITVRVYTGTSATGTPVDTRTTTRNSLTGVYAVVGKSLADGTYAAVASQSDGAGNAGTSAPRTFTINAIL
jgi:hypothetical protein